MQLFCSFFPSEKRGRVNYSISSLPVSSLPHLLPMLSEGVWSIQIGTAWQRGLLGQICHPSNKIPAKGYHPGGFTLHFICLRFLLYFIHRFNIFNWQLLSGWVWTSETASLEGKFWNHCWIKMKLFKQGSRVSAVLDWLRLDLWLWSTCTSDLWSDPRFVVLL